MQDELFAIADLASEFGISTRAIRFYESKGLISPQRVGGTRVFQKRDRVRLIMILRGKRLGFSLNEIAEYLELYDSKGRDGQTQHLMQKIEQRLEVLEQQKRDIDTTIDELTSLRELANDQVA